MFARDDFHDKMTSGKAHPSHGRLKS